MVSLRKHFQVYLSSPSKLANSDLETERLKELKKQSRPQQTRLSQEVSPPVWWRAFCIRSVWKWCQWRWDLSSLPCRNAKYRSLALMMNFGSFLSPNAFILEWNIRDLVLSPQLFCSILGLFLMLGLTTVKKAEILSGFRVSCELKKKY